MTLTATLRYPPDLPIDGHIHMWESPLKRRMVSSVIHGTSNLPVLNVQKDPSGEQLNGVAHKWFEVQLPDDIVGWVRDEYVEIVGDGRIYGLGILAFPVSALAVIHGMVSTTEEPEPVVNPSRPGKSTNPTPDVNPPTTNKPADPESPKLDRVLLAAFNITTAFEGDYASYQTIDDGIISYGRFQFTLAGGALFSVIDQYLQLAKSATAQEIRTKYLGQIQERNPSLQTDKRLRELLTTAANENEMRFAQNKIAEEKYWNLVQNLSIKPRNVQSALGQAMLFDMAINHGARHDMLTKAEEALGVEPKSRLGENGTTEELFIAKVAEIRQERMHRFADARGFPGLKPRVDFWVNLIASGDWNLQGNDSGEIEVKIGRIVQVHNP